MPLLDTPAGQIAYDERGSGDTLVLLASGAHDRHDFDELRALIPERSGQAPSIAAPTLVVWGRHDPVIPLKVGRHIAAIIPGAELVVIDSGHVPHTTDPQGFADRLIPFADTVFASASVSAG